MAPSSLHHVVHPTTGDNTGEELGMNIMENGVKDAARHVIGAADASNDGALGEDGHAGTTVGVWSSQGAGGKVNEDFEDEGVGREPPVHGVTQDVCRAEGVVKALHVPKGASRAERGASQDADRLISKDTEGSRS